MLLGKQMEAIAANTGRAIETELRKSKKGLRKWSQVTATPFDSIQLICSEHAKFHINQ